jgi:DNA-binding CsgD family transcriptional regulator
MLMGYGTQTKQDTILGVQRKVAFLAFSAGLLVSVINLVSYLSDYSFTDAIIKPAVSVIFLFSFITLASGLRDSIFLRLLQVCLALLMGGYAIMDVYNSIHGLGLILLAVFLAFKYGLLQKRPILKVLLFLFYVFGLVMFSAQVANKGTGLMHGFDAIIYLGVFLSITYIIYQDEITAYIRKAREAESEVSVLRMEREALAEKLIMLDEKITELTMTNDIDSFGLTPKEKEVIEALVVYRETEQQLAERFGISFHTVKTHFRHIRDKLGVDRREEIIEMFRNNFS